MSLQMYLSSKHLWTGGLNKEEKNGQVRTRLGLRSYVTKRMFTRTYGTYVCRVMYTWLEAGFAYLGYM